MDKVIFEALRHLRAMRQHLWLGMLTAWIVAVAGAVVVFSIPKKYEASARVFVNTDSILKPLMAGMTVQPETNQRVALLSKVIISRPNVEDLIRQTRLDEKVKSTEQRERLIDTVMQSLKIQGTGDRDNIYVLKFRDTDAARATLMIELLVNKFISSSKRNDTTEAAKQFLDEQSTAYEKRLQEAESRLKEFKLKNMTGMMTGEPRDQVAQLAQVAQQLVQARLQLREAENPRDAFRRGLADEGVVATPSGTTTLAADELADIDTRIGAMKRNLDGLLQKYTDNHPDVIGVRRVLGELEQQRQRLLAQTGRTGPVTAQLVSAGPRASEQLKVSLAQAEASVASLRARTSEYAARYATLQETVRRMPEYEAQLAQLNRDYETNKKAYENLVSRRESANIADDMLSVSGVADFRLIDPPRVSPSSVSPARALLLAATLALALGLGVGVTFVAKEARSRFYDRIQLEDVTGLPVLGVVSIVESEANRRAAALRTRRLIQGAAAMLLLYGAVVTTGFLLTKPPVA
ncbi:chain length-determining protein [Oxalobacteraceae bacterium OM1]|nr:chain length-determining protein [Oxalobacteraceae bacterium OM1]